MSVLGEVLKWVIVGLFGGEAVITITRVGKPHNATTPRIAAIIAVVDGLLIAAVLHFWGRCQ